MNTNKFDPTKPVQTRDGRKARIVARDLGLRGEMELATVITDFDAVNYLATHSIRGEHRLGMQSGSDLVNIPAEFEFEGWSNIYACGTGFGPVYQTREEADKNSLTGRIACVRVVIKGKEGEGL